MQKIPSHFVRARGPNSIGTCTVPNGRLSAIGTTSHFDWDGMPLPEDAPCRAKLAFLHVPKSSLVSCFATSTLLFDLCTFFAFLQSYLWRCLRSTLLADKVGDLGHLTCCAVDVGSDIPKNNDKPIACRGEGCTEVEPPLAGLFAVHTDSVRKSSSAYIARKESYERLASALNINLLFLRGGPALSLPFPLQPHFLSKVGPGFLFPGMGRRLASAVMYGFVNSWLQLFVVLCENVMHLDIIASSHNGGSGDTQGTWEHAG